MIILFLLYVIVLENLCIKKFKTVNDKQNDFQMYIPKHFKNPGCFSTLQ